MSGTNKTAPWPVRAMKDPARYLVEEHHHETGSCTLPKLSLQTAGACRNNPDGSLACWWAYSPAFLYGRDSGCGCPMCTGHGTRRVERRRERHQGRQLVRAEQLVDVDESAAETSWVRETLSDPDGWVNRHADLFAVFARQLGLPPGALVVEVAREDAARRCEDEPGAVTTTAPAETDERSWAVEVLFPDGTREVLHPAAEAIDSICGLHLDRSASRKWAG